MSGSASVPERACSRRAGWSQGTPGNPGTPMEAGLTKGYPERSWAFYWVGGVWVGVLLGFMNLEACGLATLLATRITYVRPVRETISRVISPVVAKPHRPPSTSLDRKGA